MKKRLKLALIGHPVSHSLSPKLYERFSRDSDIVIDYELLDIPIESFAKAISDLKTSGKYHGFNVTAPYKNKIIDYIDDLSSDAQEINSVNTVICGGVQNWLGFSTDGAGFEHDITAKISNNVKNMSTLVIGYGSVVNTILPKLSENVTIATRRKDIKVNPKYEHINFSDLERANSFDLIIQATSCGHHSCSESMCLPSNIFHKDTFCYDLNYGQAHMWFRNSCNENLILSRCFDGFGMLEEQAYKAFCLWKDFYNS